MNDQGAAAKTGGKGLLAAGIAVVLAIAVGAYVTTQQRATPSQGALEAVVTSEGSVPQDEIAQDSDSTPPVVADEVSPVEEAPVEVAPVEVAPVEEVAEEATPQEIVPDQDVAAVIPEETPEVPVVPVEEAVPALIIEPPSIDEVRLATDGVAIIAGRASPGSTVSVLVDGEEVASGVADANGAFAAIGFVTPSDAARIMTLQSTQGETVTASLEEIILAPLPAPVQTAEAPTVAAEPEVSSATVDVPVETEKAPPVDTAEVETPQDTPPVVTADAGVQETPEPSVESASTAIEPVVQEEIATVEPTQPVEEIQAEAKPQEEIVQEETAATVAEVTAEPVEEPSQQIALLKSTQEGVELLQPPVEPTQTVALDTIGYSEVGEVQLSGRANPDAAEVRVYLNNRSVASLPIDEAGTWRGGVPDIAAGVYTLRVDELGADGRVISRVETPFKREEPAVLAAATADQSGPVSAITVQAGDTLWAIARDRYGEGLLFVKVFEANRDAIRDANLIYPGQVFDLPTE